MTYMKTAIITGASGNMGQAMVTKFLSAGYRVIGTALPHEAASPASDDRLYEVIPVNLEVESDAETFMKSVIEKYGTVDVLICTVGGFAMGDIAKTGSADILKQYKLNFETAYHVARPAFAQMIKQEAGRIFLVGSRPGLNAKAGKGMIAYSLAKSLIFHLAELLNGEAGHSNVVTSVLVPSTIDTAQNRKSMPDADFTTWVQPDAIADTVYFYCTDEAAAIREPVIKLYNKA